MITNNGKLQVKRYLAQQVGSIATSVGLGLGATSETVNDVALAFEFMRADISLVTYDFVNNNIIYKAILPASFSGKVYEVGLWSLANNTLASGYGSKNIVTFDSSEVWSAGSFVATNARVGVDALQLAPGVSATVTAANTDLFLDLGGYSGADTIMAAYNVGNANTSNIKIRFKVDASNYYEFTISTPTAGYKISSFAKSTATVTGTPSWSNITSMEVATTSTAGGSSSVDFDAIRMEDVDTVNPDYVLVSRKVLAVPYTKDANKTQEIEIALAVTV